MDKLDLEVAVTKTQIVQVLKKMALGANKEVLGVLLCSKDWQKDPKEIDFLNIEKIRRRADGSVEIVFVDRLKAIERLNEYLKQMERSAKETQLFSMIEESANKKLEENPEGNEQQV